MTPVAAPDRLLVAALKRIDPKLSVTFDDPPGRYAVYYDVPFEGCSDEACRLIARDLQRSYQEAGYLVPFAECERQAYQQMQHAKLVCYVVNDDGSFRPFDQRTIQKVERMDWYRRHLGVQDWQAMMNVKADAMAKQQARDMESIWDAVRRDRRFANAAHDLVWGQRATRSIIVPATVSSEGVTP